MLVMALVNLLPLGFEIFVIFFDVLNTDSTVLLLDLLLFNHLGKTLFWDWKGWPRVFHFELFDFRFLLRIDFLFLATLL